MEIATANKKQTANANKAKDEKTKKKQMVFRILTSDGHIQPSRFVQSSRPLPEEE